MRDVKQDTYFEPEIRRVVPCDDHGLRRRARDSGGGRTDIIWV